MKNWKVRIQVGGKGVAVETQVQANTQTDAKKLVLAQFPPGTKIHSCAEVK